MFYHLKKKVARTLNVGWKIGLSVFWKTFFLKKQAKNHVDKQERIVPVQHGPGLNFFVYENGSLIRFYKTTLKTCLTQLTPKQWNRSWNWQRVIKTGQAKNVVPSFEHFACKNWPDPVRDGPDRVSTFVFMKTGGIVPEI